jgi:IS30 family transposase
MTDESESWGNREGVLKVQVQHFSCKVLQCNYTHLTTQERAVAMTMRADSCSARLIAKRLGRSPSSICRELKRTVGVLVYDAIAAHQRSEVLRVVPRRACKLQPDGALFVSDP